MEDVIGFNRDDPILECGVIKTNEADSKILKYRDNVEKCILTWAIEYNMTIEEATEAVVQYILALSALICCYRISI